MDSLLACMKQGHHPFLYPRPLRPQTARRRFSSGLAQAPYLVFGGHCGHIYEVGLRRRWFSEQAELGTPIIQVDKFAYH